MIGMGEAIQKRIALTNMAEDFETLMAWQQRDIENGFLEGMEEDIRLTTHAINVLNALRCNNSVAIPYDEPLPLDNSKEFTECFFQRLAAIRK
jgi:hypothetical protein